MNQTEVDPYWKVYCEKLLKDNTALKNNSKIEYLEPKLPILTEKVLAAF